MERFNTHQIESGANEPDKDEHGVVDIEERNWLPRHSKGDKHAFEQLLTAYRGFVMTFLWRYGVELCHRDDLFQEIFLRIHQAASSYRPSKPLRPWIVTIVLNAVRNHRRDQYRKRSFLVRLADDRQQQSLGDHKAGADQMLDQRSTILWLENRIRDLPVRQRESLVLSTMKGLRIKDIARVMGMPENTVKTHLRRARLALAEDLSRREAVEEGHE